jgi:hypothetical protein
MKLCSYKKGESTSGPLKWKLLGILISIMIILILVIAGTRVYNGFKLQTSLSQANSSIKHIKDTILNVETKDQIYRDKKENLISYEEILIAKPLNWKIWVFNEIEEKPATCLTQGISCLCICSIAINPEETGFDNGAWGCELKGSCSSIKDLKKINPLLLDSKKLNWINISKEEGQFIIKEGVNKNG